jgi:hypothetical protein
MSTMITIVISSRVNARWRGLMDCGAFMADLFK